MFLDDEGFEHDPEGKLAPFPGETRRQACARWAAEDEIEEDPERAAREMTMLRALEDEEIFAGDLARRSLESLPTTVRRLYKRNPSNAKLRELHEKLTEELFARTDDVLRASLLDSVEEIVSLMDNADPAVRLRASTYVFERLRGKTPEVIEHKQAAPFEVVLDRLVTGPRIAGERMTQVEAGTEPIDAEIVLESITDGPAPAAAVELTRTRRPRRKKASGDDG